MRKVSKEKTQHIITTAEKLVTEGVENPTNDQVREAMGGGSIADISPVMREWREKNKSITVTLLKMPEALKDAATRFSAELWSAADAEAQKKIESVRQGVSEQLIIVTGEREEALQEISRLEDNVADQVSGLSDLLAELNTEKAKSSELDQLMQARTTERDTAKALLEASEKRADEIMATLSVTQEQQSILQKELIVLAKKKG